jgi:hypothetical protein
METDKLTDQETDEGWGAFQAEQWEEDMRVMRQIERDFDHWLAFPGDRYLAS